MDPLERTDQVHKADPNEEGRPPIFSSWNALYAAVVVYAIVLILIFYTLSVTLDYSGGR